MHVQLLHEFGPVLLDGLYADAEEIGDLLILIPLGNQLQDFPLPLGERFPGRFAF